MTSPEYGRRKGCIRFVNLPLLFLLFENSKAIRDFDTKAVSKIDLLEREESDLGREEGEGARGLFVEPDRLSVRGSARGRPGCGEVGSKSRDTFLHLKFQRIYTLAANRSRIHYFFYDTSWNSR